MRWVWRSVVGLLVLAVVVPVLVVVGAMTGLSPRHWSGTQLISVEVTSSMSVPPPATEGRTYSDRELASLRDRLTLADVPEGTLQWGVDDSRRQVVVGTTGLTHSGFFLCGDRYGDAVALYWLPFGAPAENASEPAAPSAWHRPSPWSSWFTLATGFPWYLAAGVLLTVGGWLLLRLRRARTTRAASTTPAAPTTPDTAIAPTTPIAPATPAETPAEG